MKSDKDILKSNKIFYWIFVGTAMLLMIPFFAMQFTSEVNWGLEDFVVMGVLIFGLSSGFVLTARKIKKSKRLFVAIAFLLGFLWLWAELAVGIFTNWGS